MILLVKGYESGYVSLYVQMGMVHSQFLQKKAKEYRIHINEPTGRGKLCVCKKTLEGIWQSLRGDLEKVMLNIETLKRDLCEIHNEFDDMRSTSEGKDFISLGYLSSVEGIRKNVENAYCHICTASRVLKDQDGAATYNNCFNYLLQCREALREALSEFLI